MFFQTMLAGLYGSDSRVLAGLGTGIVVTTASSTSVPERRNVPSVR